MCVILHRVHSRNVHDVHDVHFSNVHGFLDRKIAWQSGRNCARIPISLSLPPGNSDVTNPGTQAESRCKNPGPAPGGGGGCWCLELTDALF